MIMDGEIFNLVAKCATSTVNIFLKLAKNIKKYLIIGALHLRAFLSVMLIAKDFFQMILIKNEQSARLTLSI